MKKTLALCAAAAIVFTAAFYGFGPLFLQWKNLLLTGLASLLCGAAFGLQAGLLAKTFALPGSKKPIIAGILAGALLLAVKWAVLSIVNADTRHNSEALKLARLVCFILFGLLTAALLWRLSKTPKRALKRVCCCMAALIFAVPAVLPFVNEDTVSVLLHKGGLENMINNYAFSLDAAALGEKLPNVKSNLNRYGGRFTEDPVINETHNPYDFIDYIQLMECSGGNPNRDLFKDPADFSVLDDYDFSALIASCKGILKTGAKPLLKLGNVPEKLSQNILKEHPSEGAFDVNVYPPDDYDQYYSYIKAIAGALVAEFGLNEVQSWRFGVLTEFENADWFYAPGKDPQKSCEAYCKLYDYTVQALIDVLGPEVFVGAHAMAVSEGLWDECDFIRHCGTGINYRTGEKGTRLCYISASYYEIKPGEFGKNQEPLPHMINRLRAAAEAAGLTDLIYGVDEGRILCGETSGADSDQLYSRTVGYTYQAAFDARLVREAFDCGLNYFSSWEYCSEADNHGVPTVSYHVAAQAAKFEGGRLLKTETVEEGGLPGADVNLCGAYNEETGTLRLMAYNYKNSLYYPSSADIALNLINLPFADGDVKITAYHIDDDCNWFDEWRADRKELGITDDAFAWSPDDGTPLFANAEAQATFRSLAPKYEACAELTPETFTGRVENGTLNIELTLAANTVVFYEITPGNG